MNTKEIGRKAIKSTKWVFLSTVISKLFQSIVMVILARLLTPADFGLLAYALIYMSMVALFQELGMGQALIQKKERIEEAADAVFLCNIILGILWFVGTIILSPFVASFFKSPEMASVLRVMALNFLIVPFGSVQNTMLSKELYFKKLFYLGLAPSLIPGIISIPLAYQGYEVWALVYGSLIGSFLHVTIIWYTVPWRPKWRFDHGIVREMIGFGGKVSMEGLLSWAVNTIDDVLVGKWLGSRALGIYRLGFNLAIWPAVSLASPLSKVVFSVFSKLQEDKEELRRVYLKAMKYISLITFPAGIGIATTAHLFVPILFGEKWLTTVPVIQLITIYGIFMSIGLLITQVYKAIGRPDIYLKYVAVRSAVTLPVFFFVVPFGLVALSLAHLILTVVFFPINFYIGMRVLGISFNKVFEGLNISIVCSICVAIFIFLLEKIFLYGIQLSYVWTLCLIVLSAILFYFTLLFFISRGTFIELKGLFTQAIAR